LSIHVSILIFVRTSRPPAYKGYWHIPLRRRLPLMILFSTGPWGWPSNHSPAYRCPLVQVKIPCPTGRPFLNCTQQSSKGLRPNFKVSHNNHYTHKQETAHVYKYIPCNYNAQTRKPTHTKYPHPPHTQEKPAYRTYRALLLGAVLKHVKALALRLAPAAHLPRTMLPCSIAFTA